MKSLLLITHLFFPFLLIGQGLYTNLLILEKGKTYKEKPDLSKFSRTGFYLYRNCLYDTELQNGRRFFGRLIDIKPDTLVFSSHLNTEIAALNKEKFDTTAYHYSELEFMYLSSTSGEKKRNLHNCTFKFFNDSVYHEVPSAWVMLNDSPIECVPYLTKSGLRWAWEVDSTFRTNVYFPDSANPFRKEMYGKYIRKYFAFIPLSERQVDEIDGISISLLNEPSTLRDSIILNGINVELNPLGIFAICFGAFIPNVFISEEQKQTEVYVNGIGLSLGGYLVSNTKLNGLYIGGAITDTYQMNGLSISGLNHTLHEWNGVTISGIGNQSEKGRGLQISLFNSCADFRGVQIGLWNRNGKRALPFINWQFRD